MSGRGTIYKTLGEIAIDMYRGAGIKRDEIMEDGIPCVHYGEICTTYDISFETCVSRTKTGTKTFGHSDILFAITSESVEEIAKSCTYLGHEQCFAGGDIVVMKHTECEVCRICTYNNGCAGPKEQGKNKKQSSTLPNLKGI